MWRKQLPTVERIHREAYKLPIQNHVRNLGIMLLQALEVEIIQAALETQAHVAAAVATADDAKIDQIIGTRKAQGKWPVAYARPKQFTNDDELKKIRLYNSEKHCHGMESIPKTDKNKEGRAICALCTKGKIHRTTTKRCSTCLIPLCTKRFKTENHNSNNHFTKWHTVTDLVREHKRCWEKLAEIRAAGRADNEEEEKDEDGDGDGGDSS